jgi:hypothetical protein
MKALYSTVWVHIVAYILGTKLAYMIDVPDTACSKAAICANGIAS